MGVQSKLLHALILILLERSNFILIRTCSNSMARMKEIILDKKSECLVLLWTVELNVQVKFHFNQDTFHFTGFFISLFFLPLSYIICKKDMQWKPNCMSNCNIRKQLLHRCSIFQTFISMWCYVYISMYGYACVCIPVWF